MALEKLEHYISINLIEFDDISYPIYWWIKQLDQRRNKYEVFLNKYDFGMAINFLNRFHEKFKFGVWKKMIN